jgi:hypothetical protein
MSHERINTSIDEKKQADCLQGRLFLEVYESVTNTEKPQVLRCVFMRFTMIAMLFRRFVWKETRSCWRVQWW